jgi:hypothetical protein
LQCKTRELALTMTHCSLLSARLARHQRSKRASTTLAQRSRLLCWYIARVACDGPHYSMCAKNGQCVGVLVTQLSIRSGPLSLSLSLSLSLCTWWSTRTRTLAGQRHRDARYYSGVEVVVSTIRYYSGLVVVVTTMHAHQQALLSTSHV